MCVILCPTRGGPGSYKNQDKAIEIAAERGCKLVFLYVSGIAFSRHLISPIVLQNIQDDLEDMGEFLLAMAQERAEKQNVVADTMIKQGVFSKALLESISELDVSTLIVGSPDRGQGLMTEEYLENLANLIHETKEIEIILLKKGEVVNRKEGNL